TVELAQVTGNALLNLRHAPLHLRPGKVLVSVVYRLELAAIDRDADFPEQAHSSAKKDEPGAYLTNRPAIVLAEVGNRSCGQEQAGSSATSPRRCVQPRARAAGSTEPD